MGGPTGRSGKGGKGGAGTPTWSDKTACVACKLVWTQALKNVKDRTTEFVGQAFDKECSEAGDLFYHGCDEMYGQAGFMIQDAVKGLRVDTICECARMCGPGTLKGGGKAGKGGGKSGR